LALVCTACFGTAARRDRRELRERCGVSGSPVDEQQARCIAEVFGVQDKARCPMRVERQERNEGPVYRVFEDCTGLGVLVEEATGRVVAVVRGDRLVYE
jgi:hypothetical protein